MSSSLARAVREAAVINAAPDLPERSGADAPDSPKVLERAASLRLAREFFCAPAEVDAEALRQGIIPRHYRRNHATFSHAQQIRLLESTVCLVGLGGLGGIVLEGMARLGAGHIRGADGDMVEESNCNRQLLATARTMGVNKAEAAAERMAQTNPCVRFTPHPHYVAEEAMFDYLRDADLVLDCLGGLRYRLALQEAAQHLGIPLVTGAIAGWSGYVASVLPGERGEGDIIPAQLMDRFTGSGTEAEESLGTQAPGVYSVGALMCCQAAQVLTEGKASLAGKMLIMDLKTMDFEKVSLTG